MTEKDYSHLHGDARLEVMVADEATRWIARGVVVVVLIAVVGFFVWLSL